MADNANIDVAKFNDLIMPILQIVKENGGLASNETIFASLKTKGFSDGGIQPGNKTRTQLEYRAAWARTYLRSYGALENPHRGQWQITSKGEALTEKDVPQIVSSVVKRAQETGKKRKNSNKIRNVSHRAPQKNFAPVEQARVILDLMEKGILSQASANKALLKVVGAHQ